MKKAAWKKKIESACKEADTYQPFFDTIIDTLADIMERRDDIYTQFMELGGKAVIKHTNKGGATNLVKNPMIVIWDDLNKSALTYWRDLGLTPSGLKKITGDAPKKDKKKSALADALAKLDG